MRVDLKKALAVSGDCMTSRARLTGVMRDLYPEEKRDVNILLSVYESGAPARIIKKGDFSADEYRIFLKKIMDEYGMQEEYAMQALDAWVDVLLGNGKASMIKSAMPEEVLHTGINRRETYTFQEITGGYAIKDYKGGDQTILFLPDTHCGLPVTRIARDAFCDNPHIRHVFLGKQIRVIESGAFRGCRRLEGVQGLEQIEYIGEGAFCDCERLAEIRLSENVYYLGRRAFSNTAITTFEVPGSIDYISAYLLRGCKKLKNVSIHSGVIALGTGCFMGCVNLADVYVPVGVRYIGQSAFFHCADSGISERVAYARINRQEYMGEDVYVWNSVGSGSASSCASIADRIGIYVKTRWKSEWEESQMKVMKAFEESDEVTVERREGDIIVIFKHPSEITRRIIDSLLMECFKTREPGSRAPLVMPYTKERLVAR